MCADVQNAYLNAKPRERVWFRAGDEFRAHKGKTVVVIRALYGLKGAGSAWAAALCQLSTNCLAFQAAGDNRIIDIWFGGGRAWGRIGVGQGFAIQAQDSSG